ncbi:hypothetical protein WJX72_012430 [[Myrmecia] bisecta]|uniref:Formin-like protein n=1 Tax=[Myrmecia] bisecta TaxID=41462 RepID=A0AAW1RA67_9CHLO
MAIREGVEGYLYKRGDVVKSWRLRYFVLQPTPEPLLTYYRNVESGEAPANSLLLQGGRVSNDGSPSHGKLFRFDVEADGQRYCLATLNEEDRRTWVAAITAAAARGGTAGASSSDQFPVPHSNGNITPVSSQGLREGSDGSSSASPNGSPGKPGQASLGAHAHVPAAQNEDAFVTPPPTRHARRMTSDAVGSAGHSGGPHGMLRKASSCTALRPPQLPSPLSGRGPGPGTPLPPPSSGKRRSILSVIRGAIMTLSAPSEMASTISEESGDSSTLNGYNANLRPLRSRGPASKALLQDNARGGALSLFEQFERAQQYVDKHRDEFSPERLSDLQGWAEAARNTAQHSAEASLAATALYVLEVTRTNSSWATWSESDTHFVSPENMISEVRRWPSVRTLEDLRECLSFGATSWIAVYCRLGGAELLMEALGVHKEAAEEGSGEASEALLATLQCMHTLMSGAGGIAASLAAAGLVAKLCMILDVEDPEGSKLVIDMLVKLCLFSSQGYSIALKTLLGEDTSKASLGPGSPLAAALNARMAQAEEGAVTSAPASPPTPSPPAGPAREPISGGKALFFLPPPPPPPPPKAGGAPPAVPGTKAASAAAGSPAHAPDPLPEYCSTLVALLKVEGYNGVDIELCDHVVLFVNVAIDSIEAVPDLRKRFVTALLEKGLMKAVAELQEFGDAHINEELEVLKLKIREVLAPPKPSPTKAKAPPPAAPAPPRPPPPPPPGMRPGGPRPPPPPSKPKVAPGPQPGRKMKSFFWDKLPDNRVSGTFWERNPPSYDNLDTAEVEELFQALQRTSLKKATTAAKKLAVLDLKRATAIGIRMSRLKVPWEHMRTAIVTLDGDAFRNADDVRTLLQCVPTDDERKMLDSYIKTGGKPELLSAAELFCLDLMKVPRIEARLGTFTARFEAMQQLQEARGVLTSFAVPRIEARLGTFTARFEAMQQLQEARGVLTDHLAAHRELRASGSFRAVLVLALALGNFMNWGTRLGQAPGFRLKNLPKLQDTRSLDGKTTLLRYIAHTLCTADPPHRLLSQEVPHVSGATLKTSQQEIADMVDKVAAMMASVRAELKHVRQHVSLALQARGEGVSVQLQSDNYHDIMCETLQEVEGEVEQLQAVQKQCRESFAGLVAFFGENVNALASDADFWPDVQAFVERFSACQRQIFHQIQEQEDMRRRKEIQRTSSERLTRSPTAVKPHQALRSPSSPTPTAPVEPGHLLSPRHALPSGHHGKTDIERLLAEAQSDEDSSDG